MPVKNIIPSQKINPARLQRAREMRHNMTPAERLLWQELRGNRLGGFHFRRQQIIAGFIVDFYCHAASLVVEVDGEVHLQQKEYDLERDATLMAMGLRVLHFPNEKVIHNLAGVLVPIQAVCKE